MAKKKGKPDKNQETADEKNAVNPAQAELVIVTPATEIARSGQNTELSSAQKNTDVSSAKNTDIASASCMEVASTPCTNIADTLGTAVLDAEESPELWADLANAPCTDIVIEPCTDITTESCTDLQQGEGGVSDLVTQQLRQMFEEGGATATCASAGSFTGTHTMNLNVKAGAVDMNLSTVTEANQESLELKTQIDLLQRLLEESGVRLEVANQRIGSLEAEMALKDKALDEKLEQGSWLRSLFGL